MMYGLFHLSIWGYIAVTLILTHITTASVTIFLHRCQAHRGLNLHPIISHFFRLWTWLGTGMVTKEWVAVHRKHHAKVETEMDPHSPQVYSLKRVFFLGGVGLYRKAAREPGILEQYGIGTPNDWIERNIYTRLNGWGIFITLAIDLVLFGVIGPLIWLVQMIWIPFFAAGVINGVGHYWGYRNFESPDASRNIVPWGILVGGEELHNNHHTFGSSAKLSAKWWEFDIGWFYIRILEILGLAKVKKSIPKLHTDPNRLQIDMDSVRVLINHRFQIMDRYLRRVVLPVLREERLKAGTAGAGAFRRARKLLVREQSIINFQGRQRLETLLNHYQNLQIVYQFRLKLQSLWQRRSHTQGELLEHLQEWCKQAEATGLQVLQDFVDHLKKCSPKPI